LEALIKDSLSYARLMLALYEVVSSDFRTQNKDHSAYQEWALCRYLEELPDALRVHAQKAPQLLQQREELSQRIAEKEKAARQLEAKVQNADFYKARSIYYQWLYKHNFQAWVVLDPVVSFHPDSLIFEVFSQDESSYGRVTVPTDRLDIFGTAVY